MNAAAAAEARPKEKTMRFFSHLRLGAPGARFALAASVALTLSSGALAQAAPDSDSTTIGTAGGLPSGLTYWNPTSAAAQMTSTFSTANTQSQNLINQSIASEQNSQNLLNQANAALSTATANLTAADNAYNSAQSAESGALGAVSTASAAEANASNAVNYANSAAGAANAAVGNANYANSVAGNAINTANSANSYAGYANSVANNAGGSNPVVGFDYDYCTGTIAIYKNGAQQVIWTPSYECGGGA
jgi:hypothetical protein